MINNLIVGASLLTLTHLSTSHPSANIIGPVLSARSMSLQTRQPDRFVNGVFKDNILLNLNYLSGGVQSKDEINWDKINQAQSSEFRLNPGEVFAFHDDLLPEYRGRVVRTTNAHFNYSDGFKSDGYLSGDGVCHLASLINWAARDANLLVESPTNHNFANIPEVPRQYGVSIYDGPGASIGDEKQNLYITNNYNKPVTFRFNYQDSILTVIVSI